MFRTLFKFTARLDPGENQVQCVQAIICGWEQQD